MKPHPVRGVLAGVALGAGLFIAGIVALSALVGPPPIARDPVTGGAQAMAAPEAPARDPATASTPAAPPAPVAAPEPEEEPEPTPEEEPVPPPLLPARDDKAELQARLAALLTDERLAGADVALHVVDEAGREVFDHRAGEPLIPASTAKLVTAAAALAEFGPGYRFTTEVYGTAEPGPDGVLHGDLVLIGGADPALGTPQFGQHVDSRRPRTPLEYLAGQLSAAGIRHVTGRVVGDPTVLPHEPVAAGWIDRYLRRGDATYSSGLTVDAGRRLFVNDGVLQSAPADDPASEAAASLTVLLTDGGVTVQGQPAASLTPPHAPFLLAGVDSPPLLELLAHTVRHSDNHLADTIFRALGERKGDGSWAGSALAVRQALAPLRLDWSSVVLADGSGLSRDDRLAARFLTTLDVRMHESNRAAEWREVMAVSGRSGTLRLRLRGTVAEGRLAGKTGTLLDTRSLAGTVDGPDGTRYHFAVLANALAGPAVSAGRELQDAVTLALAGDLYGCEWVPAATVAEDASGEGAGAQAGEEPAVLECAA